MFTDFCRAQIRNGEEFIRHGAKLLYAFAEATVPKLTVIMRKAFTVVRMMLQALQST